MTQCSLLLRWTYLPGDAPNYHVGHFVNLASQATAVIIALLGVIYCTWENKKRAAGKRDYRLANLDDTEQARLGHDHPSFQLII